MRSNWHGRRDSYTSCEWFMVALPGVEQMAVKGLGGNRSAFFSYLMRFLRLADVVL